jgi:hypothetical protein
MSSTNSEQVGKVFLVLAKDLRLCLICESVFSRRDAAEHATTLCNVRATQPSIIFDPRPHVTSVMSLRVKP